MNLKIRFLQSFITEITIYDVTIHFLNKYITMFTLQKYIIIRWVPRKSNVKQKELLAKI